MDAPRRSQPGPQRPKGKTPAERAVEFTAAQRQLKEEAAARREAAKADAAARDKPS